MRAFILFGLLCAPALACPIMQPTLCAIQGMTMDATCACVPFAPVCGDGIVTPPEQCDPQNQAPGAPPCDSLCSKSVYLLGGPPLSQDGRVPQSEDDLFHFWIYDSSREVSIETVDAKGDCFANDTVIEVKKWSCCTSLQGGPQEWQWLSLGERDDISPGNRCSRWTGRLGQGPWAVSVRGYDGARLDGYTLTIN